MRRLTGLSMTATAIGAALFSMMASATTLVPLAPVYDPTTKLLTIGVGVDGDSPTGTVEFVYGGPGGPISLGRATISQGVALLKITPYASGTLTGAHYAGDAANTFASASFRLYWPSAGWLHVVLEE